LLRRHDARTIGVRTRWMHVTTGDAILPPRERPRRPRIVLNRM